MTTHQVEGQNPRELLPRTAMFIDGAWCAASDGRTRSVDNPATEAALAIGRRSPPQPTSTAR